MKGWCHFTGGEQKSEAHKVCAEADCRSALINCATQKSSQQSEVITALSFLNNMLTDVT